MLGDCWLLSTCAALAKKEELMYRVIDPSQVLYGPGYTGLVKVNVWRYGHWVTVYIDDRYRHTTSLQGDSWTFVLILGGIKTLNLLKIL